MWYGGRHFQDELEDLYDSDDYDSDGYCSSQAPDVSKQVVKTSSLSSADSWLELTMEEGDEETVLARVEAKIAATSSTALKGIPPRIAEAIETETCLNSPTVEAPLEEEPSQGINGDDCSVFPNWLEQLGSVVGGFDDFQTCNSTGELDQTI